MWRPLPVNWSTGRPQAVNGIVIHHFAGGNLAAVHSFLSNPARRASYHFGVGRDGTIWQFVDTANTAWHAGNVNGRTIGIGHEGNSQAFTDRQMNATASIIRWARTRHGGIPRTAGVTGHRQWMATACPGQPMFNQLPELVRRANQGATPQPPPPPPPPAAGPRRYVGASMQQLVFGSDNRCSLGLPRGATHLRLTSAQAVAVTVAWPGAPANTGRTANLHGNAGGRADFAIPQAQTGQVVVSRPAGNTAVIDATWIVT